MAASTTSPADQATKMLFAVAVACSKGGDAPPVLPAMPATVDVAAVNALVPATLADKLTFEKRAITATRGTQKAVYTLAVPAMWRQMSGAFVDLKADDKGGLFSRMYVGASCDGTCEPKDWDAVTERVLFGRAGRTIVRDVRAEGSRLMVFSEAATRTTTVARAWWVAGGAAYFECVATLDEAIRDAVPAFEKACGAVDVVGE